MGLDVYTIGPSFLVSVNMCANKSGVYTKLLQMYFSNCEWPFLRLFGCFPLPTNTVIVRYMIYKIDDVYSYEVFAKFGLHQTLANQGPDSRFALEAIIKALISKSSRSSIMIILNRVHSNHNP